MDFAITSTFFYQYVFFTSTFFYQYVFFTSTFFRKHYVIKTKPQKPQKIKQNKT
jgi:hypothetical protein